IAKTIWACGSNNLAVDPLIRRLGDKEWRVVVNACQSLEKMKDLKSIFPLKELLKHDDSQIRIAALCALRAFKSKELKQFFIPLLNDPNPTVAKLTVEALSELEDKTLADNLRNHLNHPRPEVRYQIVKALGRLKCQTAVDSLIKLVETDQNNGVRAKAVLALAKIQDKKALNPVLELLSHEDRDLVIAAIKFFLAFEKSDIVNLEEKLKVIFLENPWIKSYFLRSFLENQSKLLESVLRAVSTQREIRRMETLKGGKPESGMSSEEALLLGEIITEKCGLRFSDKKVLEKQLSRDLQKFYVSSWMEYYHTLKYGQDSQSVLMSLYDTVTDPCTGFFSEPNQNKVLAETLIPELIQEFVKSGREQIRILSCGCSFGPETYSLAMLILEEIHSDKVKAQVTGVDISHICLNTAKRGIYKREMLRSVDQKYVDLYFEDDRGDLRIKDDVKNLTEFKYLNLSSTKEMEDLDSFDIIVCRNVFKVFSQRERERLAENIYNVLSPGGALLISSNESLYNVSKAFKLQTYEKVVVYRKA
ncbi:HEAT repeat domain-containing protein, partial [bacterium]|nr:HEAT repeat domain-containing protein [bacterium]